MMLQTEIELVRYFKPSNENLGAVVATYADVIPTPSIFCFNVSLASIFFGLMLLR